MSAERDSQAPATTAEAVHEVVKGYPYTSLQRGRELIEFVRAYELRRVLELGICHGVSTCYLAAGVAGLGGGQVVAIDRLEVAAYRPGVQSFAEALGLTELILPIFERVTYNWRLRDFLGMDPRPVFDLVLIDGGHTFEPDALAFLLTERLLRPGGWWILDDLNWSIAASPTARRPPPGGISQSEEEAHALQVREVVNLVIRPHPHVAYWREDGKWGFARKKTLAEMQADERQVTILRERAATSLAHAQANFPEPIEVAPGLPALEWRRAVDRGLERNRKARTARDAGQ